MAGRGPTLVPADATEAAAAEIALLMMLGGHRLDYDQRNHQVAEVLASEGWHNATTGEPIAANQIGWLLAELSRRLHLLGFAERRRLGTAQTLTPAGTAAAYIALRHYALSPRTST